MSAFRESRSGLMSDLVMIPMGNKSFDDLLEAFQSALVAAQNSLQIRREESIRRIREADETDGVRSSYLTFVIPRNGENGETCEMLPVPVSSFRAQQRLRISMLSLEFECEVREKVLTGASRRYSLAIPARNQKRWWRKKRRRMQIVFHGIDNPAGEVRIDGKLLAEIPQYGVAGKGCPAPAAKKSIFLKLLDLLRNAGQPERFTLSVEQSARVREILEQADAGTLTAHAKPT